jgi:hypothetical protein
MDQMEAQIQINHKNMGDHLCDLIEKYPSLLFTVFFVLLGVVRVIILFS